MTNLVWPRTQGAGKLKRDPEQESPEESVAQIRRLVFRMAIATLLLMAIGSATRVMNAGLACPDWPLCYGTLFPSQQMNLQVFLEWFHRLDAAFVGLSALILVGQSWWRRRSLPPWLPWASLLCLGLILGQVILGALTVTELLRFDIVTAHLGTALLFFTTLVVIGAALLPYQGTGTVGSLGWLGLLAATLIYGQSLLGALVASQWALHQCLGFTQLCTLMHSHLWGVMPPTLTILLLIVLARRIPALHPQLRQLTHISGLLLASQILLGVATFTLHLQVEPLTVAHQGVGASLLGTLATLTVLAFRDRQIAKVSPGDQEQEPTSFIA